MITRRIWLGACGAGILGAQGSVPETAAGRVLALWLEAFNSGDRAKLRAFLERHSPDRLSRMEQLMDTREVSGGFQLIRVEKSEPLAIEALLKEKDSDTIAQLAMTIEPGEPAKIGKLGVRIVPPPEGLGPARLSQSEAIAALDRQAAEDAAAGRFAGALLIAKDGKTLIEKAYGLADRDLKKPNRADTQFRMGSMNKMFTSVAALQLVAKGKMALEDPVGKFLPGYPNRAVAEKVQLRHLLSHTGGMGDIFTDEYDKKRLEVREPEDYVKLFGARAPEFEPGTKWAYANYGMMLAGVLVAKAAGKSYYDVVREQIFRPAGMTRTDSLPESQALAGRSPGYMKREGKWVSNADTLPWRGTPAGGGYTTVGDLLRFALALESGKLLSKSLLTEATKPQGPAGAPPYGFGFQQSRIGGLIAYGHGGGAPGMNGMLLVEPKTATVIAVLANLDPPAAQRLADFYKNRMPLG